MLLHSESLADMDSSAALRVEQLLTRRDSSNPASKARKLLFYTTICVVLVLVNANDSVCKSLSQDHAKGRSGKGYLPISVMLVSSAMSVLIGNAICVWRAFNGDCDSDTNPSSTFWVPSQLLQMLVPAACFTFSGNLRFVALGVVNPDFVTAMEQSSVILCAALGWVFMGKRYSAAQWVAILTLTCGLLWFDRAQRNAVNSQEGAAERHLVGQAADAHLWAGLALMILSVLMVTAGGLSCELLLKDSRGRPFFVQKAQMEFGMALFGVFYALCLQPALQGSCPLCENGLFDGWDRWTVFTLCLHTAKSWLATTTVLFLDNLAFTLAGNVSMLLVYAETILLLDGPKASGFRPEVLGALVMTALSAVAFVLLAVVSPLPPMQGQSSSNQPHRRSWCTATPKRKLASLLRPLLRARIRP